MNAESQERLDSITALIDKARLLHFEKKLLEGMDAATRLRVALRPMGVGSTAVLSPTLETRKAIIHLLQQEAESAYKEVTDKLEDMGVLL